MAASVTITQQLQDPATSNEVLREVKELATRARNEAERKIRKYAKQLGDGKEAGFEVLGPAICAIGRVWMHADTAMSYLHEREIALKTEGKPLPKFDPPPSIQTLAQEDPTNPRLGYFLLFSQLTIEQVKAVGNHDQADNNKATSSLSAIRAQLLQASDRTKDSAHQEQPLPTAASSQDASKVCPTCGNQEKSFKKKLKAHKENSDNYDDHGNDGMSLKAQMFFAVAEESAEFGMAVQDLKNDFQRKYHQVRYHTQLKPVERAAALSALRDGFMDSIWGLLGDQESFTDRFGLFNDLAR